MKITKTVKAKNSVVSVYHIEKVNDDTFLTVGLEGILELINKVDLTCLSHLKLNGVVDIIK